MTGWLVFFSIFGVFCFFMAIRAAKKQRERQQNITFGEPLPQTKYIQETKLTCQACGHVWHYSDKDAWKEIGNALMDMSSVKVWGQGSKDAPWEKCPKCGSRAMTKEKVTYEVNTPSPETRPQPKPHAEPPTYRVADLAKETPQKMNMPFDTRPKKE